MHISSTPPITTAIVAIGGHGRRMKAPPGGSLGSKSFVDLRGKPTLFWTLSELYRAGLGRIIFCGTPRQLARASSLAIEVGFQLHSLMFIEDSALGFHGLPNWVDASIEGPFYLVPGHGLAPAMTYRRLARAWRPGGFVGLSYTASSSTDVATRTLYDDPDTPDQPAIVASPYLIDAAYLKSAASFSFQITSILIDYQKKHLLSLVSGIGPIEFDNDAEEHETIRWLNRRLDGRAALRAVEAQTFSFGHNRPAPHLSP
jgi:hypothetical protein